MKATHPEMQHPLTLQYTTRENGQCLVSVTRGKFCEKCLARSISHVDPSGTKYHRQSSECPTQELRETEMSVPRVSRDLCEGLTFFVQFHMSCTVHDLGGWECGWHFQFSEFIQKSSKLTSIWAHIICNKHKKWIKMSTNMPVVGPVVLEITYPNIANTSSFNSLYLALGVQMTLPLFQRILKM